MGASAVVPVFHTHERPGGGSVKSAGRVLDIFETLCCEPRGLSLSELASRLRLANSSAHALVHTMLGRGYLRRDPETRRYALGIKLVQLGLAVTDDIDFRTVARGILERQVVETQETVFMGQLDGDDLVYVEKVVSTSTIVQLFQVDRLGPAVARAAIEISQALGWQGTQADVWQPTKAAA